MIISSSRSRYREQNARCTGLLNEDYLFIVNNFARSWFPMPLINTNINVYINQYIYFIGFPSMMYTIQPIPGRGRFNMSTYTNMCKYRMLHEKSEHSILHAIFEKFFSIAFKRGHVKEKQYL